MKTTLTPKRILTALLCMVVLLTCATVPALAAAEGPGGETLTVGVPADRCPVFYRDADTGEIVGIGVDLMRAAAKEAGYAVTFRAIEESTLKDALDNPDYDVVMPFGSAVASASGQPTVVSDNLTQTPFTLVTTHRGNLPPLNELRVGMLRSLGAGAETVRQLYPGIQITMYETMAESVKALRAGKEDALLHNSYVWSYVLQKPAYSDLAVQPSAMFSMDFRAGAPDTPEGNAIIERLNEGIATLTDTHRQAIVLDYTTRRLYRYDFSDYIHQYGLAILFGALLIAAIIVIVVLRQRNYRLEQEEKMQRLIDQDPLTGALSLNGFRKRVEELLRAHPDAPYLLSYNNIRNFKYINDSLGRTAGDELLRFWAERSAEIMAEEEAMCRVDSDHLAFLRHIGKADRIQLEETHVYEPMRSYFIDRGGKNRVQISAGVYVLTPEDFREIDVDRMLDHARLAEKKARETLKDGYEIYNPDQWERGRRVADVVGYLPNALETGEIQVWYQPQVSAETGAITGIEALSRWNHSKLGWLQPTEFISTLEEAGLIYGLDCYVWDKVCRDLQRWNAKGKRLSVSVNLSRCDIREDRNIPGQFFDLVQKYGLSADQLRIEITETAYAENPEALIRTTKKLREFGFEVEMDDFGSGYSSLHMLKEVPVDRIKLDLHFLTGTGDPERGRIIVGYMIQMIHSLGMKMIAEGVENATQAEFLRSRGCTDMQGFHFYKPVSVLELEEIILK
jgi:EAL domain-containing protein (putative c-di-GMP-specific phosphodiesterase class I)/GGDEF domain-containing protein/ABC-type amino acid transport substrate-binding protein